MTDPHDEVDVDTFLFGRPIDMTGGGPQRSIATDAELAATADPKTLVRERILARQQTMEGGEEPVGPKATPTAASRVVGVILTSRTGNERPHIVTIQTFPDGSRATVCTCEAMMSVAIRPELCWAAIYVRELVGIPQPGGPT